ncbi:putative serine/threonine-protein kinase RIO3 [Apostichopus japonicus]|uniref:Serine/threonine-protein kinase RIO3 n=1 Tax=Stichopus japonicus TaxID=307972 RepID=A0A2G8L098_STIJA|nr:putative serine/threonine-protein kinase RIO3 [Apostichopus japonicus]
MAVDPRTRILLFKLVNGGILESINGTISTGKEAVVIHASGGRLDQQIVPVECALKVFKTTLNEFKNRQKYIKDDYRFKDRFSKQNPRRTIRMWAEKEMHNLNRMREAGIRTPDVILLKKHILVMTFIGENQKAAPKLKMYHCPLLTNKLLMSNVWRFTLLFTHETIVLFGTSIYSLIKLCSKWLVLSLNPLVTTVVWSVSSVVNAGGFQS